MPRTPARFGEAEFGYSRFGVYTDKWENMMRKVGWDFTRYLYALGSKDAYTGIRYPTYLDSCAVNGYLVQKGMVIQYFPVGISIRLDAVFVTLDGMFLNDKVYDADDDAWYVVANKPLEYTDPTVGGFAFRVCELHRLELDRPVT